MAASSTGRLLPPRQPVAAAVGQREGRRHGLTQKLEEMKTPTPLAGRSAQVRACIYERRRAGAALSLSRAETRPPPRARRLGPLAEQPGARALRRPPTWGDRGRSGGRSGEIGRAPGPGDALLPAALSCGGAGWNPASGDSGVAAALTSASMTKAICFSYGVPVCAVVQ